MGKVAQFFRPRPQGLTTDLSGLADSLNEIYHHCDCHIPNLADVGNPADIIDRMVEAVYNGSSKLIDKAATEYFAKQFWQAVTSGFGDDLFSVSFDTPDYMLLRQMQKDVYQFASAKNYQQLQSLSRALIDDNGTVRTFSEFKHLASEINADFVTKWMKAEYEMGIASGQMGAKWARIEENKEVLPLLQFDAVLDDRTTPICHSLDGVIKPIDDSFWDLYYPPNHWGCRSDVRSLADGVETPINDIVFPDKIPHMFKTNLAKNGLVFPPGHPYYTGLPEQVKEQAQKLLKNAGH